MTRLLIQLNIPVMSGRKISSPAQYKKDLLERTKSARIMSTLTREQVVAMICERTNYKLKILTYKKWETRTPIPHFFIIPFCEVVGADPYQLLTGSPFKIGRSTNLQDFQAIQKRSAV